MSVFARVATARSFSAAARELGISQATASKHVQTLENWLGTRLLSRTTRRVALTDAGASFFAQCARILEDMETARQAGRSAAELHGNLRILGPVGFGTTRLANIVIGFMEENPHLTVAVTLSDRPIDVIGEGFDLAIRVWRSPPDDPGLIVHPLMLLPFAVCATPAYLAANGTPRVPADLARLVCLTDNCHAGDVWRFTGPDGEAAVTVSGCLKTDNGVLRREAALHDRGVLLIAEFMVEDDVAEGRLVRLLPNYGVAPMRLDAVCSAQRGFTPKVQGFLTFLTQRLETRRDGA
jgi:DNA-binding transcriptional LysR family regulator